MTNVSRADRKCAREIILSLESNPNPDPKQVTNVKKYLSSLGFPEDSEYFSRINSLEGKLTEKEKIEKEREEISSQRKFKYSGIYLNRYGLHLPLKLDFRYDHLFLSRNYKNKFENSPGLKISWRFESDGKIYLIDALDIYSRDILHVMGPFKNSSGQFSWSKKLDFLFYDFSNLETVQKADLLLKWGHTSAYELFNASLNKNVQDFSFIGGDELGLTKLSSNSLVMGILKKSSKLHPSFSYNQKFGRLEYN